MRNFNTPIQFAIILVSVILTAPVIYAQTNGNLGTPTSAFVDSKGIRIEFRAEYSDTRSRTLAPFEEVAPLQASLLPRSNTRDFTVYVNNTIELTINPTYPVPVTVDGILQGPDVTIFELNPGQHTFSVPETVELKTGSRLKFENWSDGLTSANRTEYLTADATFNPIYVMQYSLTLISPEANATGAGWYDAGSSATFSVPVSALMKGILGLLGAKWIFEGWYEGDTLISSSNQVTVSMTKPQRYHTLWTGDFTVPIIVLGITLPAALGGTYVYGRRKGSGKAVHQSNSQSVPLPSIM